MNVHRKLKTPGFVLLLLSCQYASGLVIHPSRGSTAEETSQSSNQRPRHRLPPLQNRVQHHGPRGDGPISLHAFNRILIWAWVVSSFLITCSGYIMVPALRVRNLFVTYGQCVSIQRGFVSMDIRVQGVFHQGKELERVLSTEYRVTLLCFSNLPDPVWEDPMNSLYIIMPGFSAGVAPPNYILYQTEQAKSDNPRRDIACNCLCIRYNDCDERIKNGNAGLSLPINVMLSIGSRAVEHFTCTCSGDIIR